MVRKSGCCVAVRMVLPFVRAELVSRLKHRRPTSAAASILPLNRCLTLTLAVMLSGVQPAAWVYSLFSCWACGPTRLLKLVVRWRLRSVFWGGMFSSMASVSRLNRGSSIYGKPRLFKIFKKRNTNNTTCTHDEPSVHAAAPQVRGIFCQVHWSQPLHHSVVGPLDHLAGRELVLNTHSAPTLAYIMGKAL